ncbi:hypothetical protein LXL04_010541 [Taraxacum kok-saghyz]
MEDTCPIKNTAYQKTLIEDLGVYIVSYDRPGYGESDPNPKQTLKISALDIEELADQLGLRSKFHVAGFSMGGQLIWTCLKYIPHRLAGATLIAPADNYWWPSLPANLSKQAFPELFVEDQWSLRVAHYLPSLTYRWNTQKLFPSSKAIAHSHDILSSQDVELIPKFTTGRGPIQHERAEDNGVQFLAWPEPKRRAQFNQPLAKSTSGGLPPHYLRLKVGCPVILLRNIDPGNGLCNGTRLICRSFQPHVIDAEIAVGQHAGKMVFLPRIPLSPSDDDMFPFKLERKQFPVRLCFAMTINKAQGQTIPNVGVNLPEPVFSHGQLYVALSRGISRGNTKVLVKSVEKSNVDEVYTSNVVYK